jgi:hypothetical protein
MSRPLRRLHRPSRRRHRRLPPSRLLPRLRQRKSANGKLPQPVQHLRAQRPKRAEGQGWCGLARTRTFITSKGPGFTAKQKMANTCAKPTRSKKETDPRPGITRSKRKVGNRTQSFLRQQVSASFRQNDSIIWAGRQGPGDHVESAGPEGFFDIFEMPKP